MGVGRTVLVLEVGVAERHHIEVYSSTRWGRHQLEIWVDGEQQPTSEARIAQMGAAANGAERFDFHVGQAEPHTVRIERRQARSGDAFRAFVDGRPVVSAASAGEARSGGASQEKPVRQRAESWEPWVALLGVVVGLCITAYGIVLVYNVTSSPHADARIVKQLGCAIPPGGDQGLQCDYKLAFDGNGRPVTAIIRGVNPSDVTTDQFGNRHLDIYYDAAEPSKAGDAQNDSINNVLVLLVGVAVLAIVCTASLKRRTLWRELRVAPHPQSVQWAPPSWP